MDRNASCFRAITAERGPFRRVILRVSMESTMHDHISRLLAARNHSLRTRFPSFIARCFETVNPGTEYLSNWHIDLIAEYLEATRRSEITRLIINMPPRSLKSVCVSVAWPAFLLGHDPAMRIMCASYAAGLALRHSLDTRLIMEEPWYRMAFPRTRIVPGENQKHKFVTTERGFRFATSVGGTATGEGGDVLVVDDPLSPMQAASRIRRESANRWFDQTFATRLNNKRDGRIVLVMQRLHADDLTGHLLAKGGWEQLLLPAIAESRTIIDFGDVHAIREPGDILHPGREGRELLERARRELGSFAFAAQYQQQPLPEGGGMVEPHWIGRYDAPFSGEGAITQSWDTAIKAGEAHDASACLTFCEQEGRHYLLDALTLKAEYPALKRAVLVQAERWQPECILMEDKASGQSLLQDLRRESALPLVAVMPRRDKVTRFAAVTALIEAGRLVLPRQAAWLAAFEAELFAFPNAPHDDMVDALSQYLGRVRGRGAGIGIRVL